MSPRPDFDLDADAYRRRIRIVSLEPGVVEADLQDDFHHFVVTLRHDGERIEAVAAQSERWPWSTCPAAAEPLRKLAGMALTRRFTGAGRWTDPKQNCTHQFDAACHAITHAAWNRTERVYDLEVPRRDPVTGASRCRLWVDSEPALAWNVTWEGIADARSPFDTAPWKGGFMRWADERLPEDDAERAITLRRACDIGMGRGMDLDSIPVASALPQTMAGVCHTMQPGVVEVALRHVGSIRDFARDPQLLD
ncbi:MAG TPA: DUF2889 domain-containing protein [Acidimicrobiia bacterium]|nr:DUF2889 domain-containing protein [Acidimicrobiia bacterium]